MCRYTNRTVGKWLRNLVEVLVAENTFMQFLFLSSWSSTAILIKQFRNEIFFQKIVFEKIILLTDLKNQKII